MATIKELIDQVEKLESNVNKAGVMVYGPKHKNLVLLSSCAIDFHSLLEVLRRADGPTLFSSLDSGQSVHEEGVLDPDIEALKRLHGATTNNVDPLPRHSAKWFRRMCHYAQSLDIPRIIGRLTPFMFSTHCDSGNGVYEGGLQIEDIAEVLDSSDESIPAYKVESFTQSWTYWKLVPHPTRRLVPEQISEEEYNQLMEKGGE